MDNDYKLSYVFNFEAHKNWIRDIAFNPNKSNEGYVFATGSEDQSCKIWKFANNNEYCHEYQEINFESPVWKLSWNYTGHLLSIGYTTERKNMISIFSEDSEGSWVMVKSLNN